MTFRFLRGEKMHLNRAQASFRGTLYRFKPRQHLFPVGLPTEEIDQSYSLANFDFIGHFNDPIINYAMPLAPKEYLSLLMGFKRNDFLAIREAFISSSPEHLREVADRSFLPASFDEAMRIRWDVALKLLPYRENHSELGALTRPQIEAYLNGVEQFRSGNNWLMPDSHPELFEMAFGIWKDSNYSFLRAMELTWEHYTDLRGNNGRMALRRLHRAELRIPGRYLRLPVARRSVDYISILDSRHPREAARWKKVAFILYKMRNRFSRNAIPWGPHTSDLLNSQEFQSCESLFGRF